MFKNKSRRRARAREGEGKKRVSVRQRQFPLPIAMLDDTNTAVVGFCGKACGVAAGQSGERAGGYTYRFRRLPKAPRSTRRLLSHIILLLEEREGASEGLFMCAPR